MRVIRVAMISSLIGLLAVASSRAADVTLRGIAVDLPLAAPILHETRGVSPIVRITVDEQTAAVAGRLAEAIDAYAARHVRVIIAFRALPSSDGPVEAWREFLRTQAERNRGKVAAYQIGDATSGALPDSARYAYLLKLAAVQLHAADDSALVLQGWVPPAAVQWERDVLAAGIGPYIDGLAVGGPENADTDEYRATVGQMRSLLERTRPTAITVVGPIRVPAAAADATGVVVDAAMRSLVDGTSVTAFNGDAAGIQSAMTGAAPTLELIARDLVPLDDRASGLRLLRNGADVTAAVRHALIYSPAAAETYLAYWSSAPVDLEMTVRNAPTPKILDPLSGAIQDPSRIAYQDDRLALTLPAAERSLIVDFNFGNASGMTTSVDVRNEALPRVEEIIARHQQAQAAQDAVVRTYIAHVRIEQHFHPSPADPAWNIITENRLFVDRSISEWEELSFELNGAKWGAHRPSFPLLQPEKVLSLPLDLRLNQDYTYRLDGVEDVNGRPAYVIRFEPADSTRALYRGTVWVDRSTFMRSRVQAVESKLVGPVISNDETQWLSKVGEANGRPVWLPDRSVVKQVILIAGRSVLIEREVHLESFLINPANFEQARESARASNSIMYRDTDQGVRYLVKQGESRVVSNQLTSSAKALAFGTDIDPSFDYPLPIGGINILDFNFLKKNVEFALLFGGVIALGNVQKASLWGGRFDVSADFFGLAVKANDDVFNESGRLAAERVTHIPASVGLNLGIQVTPYQKVTAHQELHYDAYFRAPETGADFVTPSNTATIGEAAGYEYRRRGYSLLLNGGWYRRSTWTPWGDVSTFDENTRTYTKYDAGLSKDFFFHTFHTIHLNGAYFGGERLDRFSMYQFGLFDPTRIHGVPSSVRFSDLAMFRGSYSFNLFDAYRFDLFIDHARGRDASASTGWLPVTGTGARVNLRTPHDTILQIDFGKSFLPAPYRGAGSLVLQILLLKPL